MKNILKKARFLLKSVVCLVLVSAFVAGGFSVKASAAESLKPQQGMLSTFYTEDKDSADVVFIGSSAVYRFISPAQMYAKYGITSLNYASAGLDIHTTAGIIREVVNYQHPKLIVIEMRNYINNCDNYMEGTGYTARQLRNKENFLKQFVANMPASANRTKVISDTVTPLFGYDATKWELENFYPKYKTDNKTAEQLQKLITKNYKSKKYTYTKVSSYKGDRYKGTVGSIGITPVKAKNYAKYKKTKNITGEWLQVLNDIIGEAKACGTKVLFMSTPHPTDKKSIAYENKMGQILKANGFKYLNCNKYYKKIGLDFSCDYYDEKHTNISGMVKVTNFVGKYIKNNYKLKKSKLTSSQKSEWKQASKLWIDEVRTPMQSKITKYKANH